MTIAAPPAPLSSQQQRRLREFLEAFDRSWDEQGLTRSVSQLPPAGDPLRLPLLAGLVRIDLGKQWQRGRRAVLEAYLKLYPELAAALPFDLVRHEYELRQRHGAAPDPAQFAKRFPAHADALRSWLLAAETQHQAQATTPPAGPPATPDELSGPFGRYRIERRLGRGGMGAVYLAHDSQLDRFVALKVPHRRAGELAPEVRQRFFREAKLAATLNHPNLCPVYDAGEQDGRCFVTMAYLEGKPLSEVVRGDKRLPQRGTAAVVRKLALALAVAHDKGIVHRDLKPANVMIAKTQEPIILDFGLARRLGADEARLTAEGAVVGTPAYLAPEQLSGTADAAGPSIDVYGLGVILYEMLTGEVPFQATPLAALIGQILTQPPPQPSTRRPDLEAELEAICLKALAKKPADRFASMKEFADALTRYLQKKTASAASGKAVQATPPPAAVPAQAQAVTEEVGPGTQLLQQLVERMESLPAAAPVAAPPRSRWPLLLGGMAAATVLLAGGAVLALFLLRGDKAGDNPSNARGPGDSKTPPPAQTVAVQLGDNYLFYDQSVNFYLDGKPVSRDSLRGRLDLPPGEHELKAEKDGKEIDVHRFRVQEKDNPPRIPLPVPPEPDQEGGRVGELRRYLGHRTPVYGVAFLPDRKRFVSTGFAQGTGRVLLWDIDKTEEIGEFRFKGQNAGAWPGSWALPPSGGQLLVAWMIPNPDGSSSMAVKRWDTRTGEELPAPGPFPVVSVVAVPPDERHVLLNTGGNVDEIWDLKDLRRLSRLEGGGGRYSPDGTRIITVVPSPDGNVGTVWLWDPGREGQPPKQLGRFDPPHNGQITGLAYFPDGKRVVTCGLDGFIRVYDVESRKAVRTIDSKKALPQTLAVSPDGRRLLTGHHDNSVRLWDVESGEQLAVLEGHSGIVYGVDFSPGGRQALSCSADGTIRLWQLPK